jgi:small subunit ribosomal protein S14
MKSLIVKDRQSRKNFKKTEVSQNLFKILKKNQSLLKFQGWWNQSNYSYFNSSSIRLKNKCLLTGRSSSISRIYKLSRIQFRELGRKGWITGLKKSSW